jgi:Phage tail protein
MTMNARDTPEVWATGDAEVLEYVSADGLTARFAVERGVTGRLMPPVDIWTDTVPLTPGSRYRGARHASRIVTVPIVTGGVRYGRDELRALARALDPMRGMGRLRSTGFATGLAGGRQLFCVYQAGLDALHEDFPHWSRVALQFLAPDPYWEDTVDQVRDFAPANVDTEWFPFPPLDLGGTNILGNFSISNSGDAEAWPSMEVQGPGENFAFENRTTGQRLEITGAIPGGTQPLRIVTQPGARSVSLGNANWFSRLTRESVLWGFVPGVNLLRVNYETTTARIILRWRLRYLTP